jgi:hypothetical protein
LAVSSISPFLAFGIRQGSVVNSPAFIPTLIFQIERGASREEAKLIGNGLKEVVWQLIF